MKKTSKKLLSFFLAVVMIITSCSIGFTAFAEEKNNDSYWSNDPSAKAAFDSLNDLVDTYVPMLLNIDAIKSLLEDNLGMTITENTTISDVVEGASPLLLGLLGGSANKAAIRGDASPLADMYFAYLDDESGAMDFYSLYKFCQDNQGASGEVGDYARETLPKLQALLDAFGNAQAEFATAQAEGNTKVEEMAGYVYSDSTINDNFGGDVSMVPLSVLEAVDVNGTALKDVDISDAQGFFDYMNGMAVLTSIEDIDNYAEAIYYMMGMGQYKLFAEMYLGMALQSGLPLDYEGMTITMENYPEVAAAMYSFDDFCNDNFGCSAADLEADPDSYAMAEAMYNDMMIPGTIMALLVDMDSMDASVSPFYYQMMVGVLTYSGLYDADSVKAFEITDAQIDSFIDYAKANFNEGTIGGQTNVDINKLIAYINSGDCQFSEPAKTYLRNAINNSTYKPQFVEFQRLATDGKKNELKNYAINFGDYSAGKSVFETVNFMIPSVLLNQNISSETTAFQANEVLGSFTAINTYKENIAPKTATVQFNYADVAVPGNLTVDVVNAKINGLLDEYLAPGAKIAGIVDINEVIGSLLESDVTLYKGDGTGALDNLWKNLHDDPIETIFKLLPILDILVDEVVVPLLLNGDNNDAPMLDLYSILTGEGGILADMSQKPGAAKPYVGIGALHFDLNTALPAILHWITGDEDGAYDIVAKYSSTGADKDYYDTLKAYCDNGVDEEGNRLTYDGGFNQIPKFINIYAADKAIYKFKLSDLEDTFAQSMDPSLAKGLTEAITEIATFAMEAIDKYIAEHGNDARYGVDYGADAVVTQRGLNNIMVALPQVLDNMGKMFIEKYNIDSDWTYCYDGKIVETTKTFRNGTVTQLQNTTLQGFKDSGKNGADAVLDNFVGILIGNWINAILDIVNDTISDKDNEITGNLEVIANLLNALGGFGEKSILTDVINGFFGLTRSDDASFTLKENVETGFSGFSNESGFFLLTNISYKDGDTDKGIVPFIMSLINGGKTEAASLSLADLLDGGSSDDSASFAPLASSRKAPGTNYDELLTASNIDAANELIDKLDSILASLLKNTSLNGFDVTSTDSVLSGAVSVVSNYLGQKETEDLLNLVDSYVETIVGENAEGPIDPDKVYTSKNLSNLVVETYSLIEAIVDKLLGDALQNEVTPILCDAICGIVSPDSVGIRMSSGYSDTADILLAGHKSWTELKGEDLDFDINDKESFYDALGESLNGIATVVGFILTGVSDGNGKNFYSELVYPIFNSLSTATGAGAVMSPADFNAANDAQKLIKGVITPLSNILGKLYDKPVTFLINLIQGLAGILDDDSLKGIFAGVVAPINGTVTGLLDGVENIVSNLSPTLAAFLADTIDGAIGDIFPLDLMELLNLGDTDIIVSLINGLLPESIASMIQLPSIDWKKLNDASTAGEALLLAYGYIVDTVLGSELLTSLIDSLDSNISNILKNLSAAQILQVLNDILNVATTPTEIYWTFSEYASKLTGTFTYPSKVSKKDADKAVKQLDELVDGVFPLLQTFGVDIGDSLDALVSDNLYTNELLTDLAGLIYGSIDNAIKGIEDSGDLKTSELVQKLINTVGFDFSTKGIAAYLTDTKYGATYTAAANKLKSVDSWNDITSLNWGFKNGSKNAQQGFVNGLAAVLRPFDDIIAVLLADGPIDIDFVSMKPAVVEILNDLNISTTINDNADLKIANGKLQIIIKGDKESTFQVDLAGFAADALDVLGSVNLKLGSNGYESAIVPLLEAFMIDDLKTYDQYVADIASAKDNVLLDVLNPLFGFVNKVVKNPVSTIAGALPNIAYFIDNNGLTQAVSNLLAPILSSEGIIGALSKNGLDIDEILTGILGTDLGSVVTDLLDVDIKLNLEIAHLEKCNIQDIVIPVVRDLLKDLLGITIPSFTFADLSSLGTLKVYQSAARNTEGTFTAKHVIADKGKVLVAVLRFVGEILTKNATAIRDLLLGIDAINSNATIKNILTAVFNNLKSASKDDIVRAVFYLLTAKVTDGYYDYTRYDEKKYGFSYGTINAQFMSHFAETLDSSVDKVFDILKELNVTNLTLNSLVSDNLYKNDLIAKIATGLYGAIEGVKVGDGSLIDILAATDIDFSTANVAKLLTDKTYGKTYAAAAKTIKNAKSWSKVNASKLDFGVKDRASFLNALAAVLRPIYGVLDAIFNDGYLNLFDLVSIPGSNGYESAIVPLLEALGVTNLKTMAQLKKDSKKAYDNILLDVLNPVFDWLEKILDAPFESIASILPSVSLFIANDGLIQVIENLLTPVSALLKALKPIVNVNDIIKALGVDLNSLLKGIGIKANVKIDVYNLSATLKPLIGQENIVPLINGILGSIKVGGSALGIALPAIDWFKLASHGRYMTVSSAAKNSVGKYTRETVNANVGETLLAVLRYVENLLITNAKPLINVLGNIDAIKNNKTIFNLIKSILNNISKAKMDDLIKAILYFFDSNCTDSFFDYTNFIFSDENDFEWGQLDQKFCESLPPMIDGLVNGLLGDKGGLLGLIEGMLYNDDFVSKIATGLYGAIEGVKLGNVGSLTKVLALTGIDFTTSNVASLLTNEDYGTTYASNASVIRAAGSWANVKADKLTWGVTDRESFVNALAAVLRPIYGVLDVLLNDGRLGIFDIVSVPGSDGYTSTIVPLLEAFSCYNIKTQYQYREDMSNAYDAVLIDILNPILDKVEDLLSAPIQTLASMLPNLSLFFANDGLLEIIENLLTPVSALLEAIRPIVDVNDVLSALGVNVNSLLGKIGVKANVNLDVYDLKTSLKPLIGAENVVNLLNGILGFIKIKGASLGIELPEIDWFKLASHGDVIVDGTSVAATHGTRIYVVADSAEQEAETLISVLRFLVNTVNYKNNYDAIVGLIGGLLGDGVSDSISEVIGTVLDLLKGDADTVILNLVDLLKSFA